MDLEIFSKVIYGVEDDTILSEDAVNKVMSHLKDSERFVIIHRFTRPFKTLRAISLICPRADGGIGLTRERISQIEAKAIRKMRRALIWERRLTELTFSRKAPGQFR